MVLRSSDCPGRRSAAGGHSGEPREQKQQPLPLSAEPTEPAMALSMPLNGLKEEDKDPIIELFVKVRALARRPA